jgi:hypothetical protein
VVVGAAVVEELVVVGPAVVDVVGPPVVLLVGETQTIPDWLPEYGGHAHVVDVVGALVVVGSLVVVLGPAVVADVEVY